MNVIFRLLIASILLLAQGVRPAMADLSEGQIKSAYVLNFVKLSEWPTVVGADDPITLCVVGSNVLDGALSALNGRKAGDRVLHVVQYTPENILTSHPNTGSSCHVLFIGESERSRFVPIIKALGNSPVLTISDIEDFAEKGGCIGLLYRENKIIFEVNMASANKAKLHLPAQLLNLASYVFVR